MVLGLVIRCSTTSLVVVEVSRGNRVEIITALVTLSKCNRLFLLLLGLLLLLLCRRLSYFGSMCTSGPLVWVNLELQEISTPLPDLAL